MNILFSILFILAFIVSGCDVKETADQKDAKVVEMQQSQYSKAQPVPVFDWSLERDLVISLYKVRNQKVTTHSVWRAITGMVEGDCPSYGYGIPYDTSLTNPLGGTRYRAPMGASSHIITVEQPEPNGVFASKNTSSTWVMCLGEAGSIEPIYVETKVTVYPGPVKVDYDKNRVTRAGASNVLIPKN